MNTFYNTAVLDSKIKNINSVDQFFWQLINPLIYYFVTVILLMGIFQAATCREYNFVKKSSFEPAVKEDGNYEVIKEEVDFRTKLKDSGK